MKKLLLFSAALLILGSWTLAQNGGAKKNTWAGAVWVWDEADAHKSAQTNEPRYLRRSFNLSARPQAAELWITADNLYVVYINGQKVGADSEWNSVEKYNVAKYLNEGKNVLAIKATNQGGVAGAIARLHVLTADKKDLFIVTDAQTKITRNAPQDWLAADFDDSSWFAAIVLGDTSISPWHLTGSGKSGVAQVMTGKGKNYGSNAVDPKIKTRLTAQEQKAHFIVPKDFEIELVAADPVVINPITMVLDDKGRIIVSESHTYRYGPPGSPIKPFANPVVRLDPDGKGGFTRTLIADGFDDPVMGIAIKGDKLWLTANNYLYTYDLPESPGIAIPGLKTEKPKPLATNKKLLLQDKSKAWNPFGMFVLEWGPDGKLYMSVGNHGINIHNTKGESITSRGGSGLVMRMNPDGTKMERLVHGLRVPYSFEYDPFGQLWLLSNGEGNPDRFVRVIEGVDYHCYSRGAVDNNWLAGNHPLAPPCEEVHGGAHTQFMRYFAAAYPQEYQGNLFACNWGRHGFAGPNRGIFRFILDERNNVVKKETLVACTDPHFRPSHIHLDVDGSLLIADWYGRDDESDMTGRIWRLKYVGKNAPVVKHKLDSPEWKNDDYAIEALGSPDHLVREKAIIEITKRASRQDILNKLAAHAATNGNPLAAANSLWLLLRIGTPESASLIGKGNKNADWRIRCLSIKLLNRASTKIDYERERDPAVRLESAICAGADSPGLIFDALEKGAAADPFLRYKAAWHLAHNPGTGTWAKLLASDDANMRLAGLISIDVACFENQWAVSDAARAALAKALENPGKLDHQLLLTVAQLDGDASIVPGLEKLIARDDLPTATIAKAVLVLKAKAGGLNNKLGAAAGKRLIEAVEKGALKIASPTDQLVLFEFLASEGPTPFALNQVRGQLQSNNKELKLAAHTLARRFGPKAETLTTGLWPSVLNPKTKFEDALEYLSTIARTETASQKKQWEQLLNHNDPLVRMEAVRWWRRFDKQPDFISVLGERAVDLQRKDPHIGDDLSVVGHFLSKKILDKVLPKDELAKLVAEEVTKMPAGDRGKRAAMGLQVFERNSCTKCHTTATQTTLLAPSLKGIAQQKVDYLIESVLYPSKIIKTGFESETVVTTSGKILTGLVKEEGQFLRVLNLDKEDRIAKKDVESRAISRVSVMPDGQEATMSRREFVDLIVYLTTLK